MFGSITTAEHKNLTKFVAIGPACRRQEYPKGSAVEEECGRAHKKAKNAVGDKGCHGKQILSATMLCFTWFVADAKACSQRRQHLCFFNYSY